MKQILINYLINRILRKVNNKHKLSNNKNKIKASKTQSSISLNIRF